MTSSLKIADLSKSDVARIQKLESALASHIMAYQPGLHMANLTDKQIQDVKEVEKELGVILLAYGQ
jgi:hypothetical protein